MIINNTKYSCPAVLYAAKKHKFQVRSSWDMYIVHPLNVMNKVKKNKLWKVYEQASVLHDVCEDCWVWKKEIGKRFWNNVADIVYILSKNPKEAYEKSIEWHNQRLKDYINKLDEWINKDPNILFIKIYDQLDNLESLHIFGKEKFYRILNEIKNYYLPLYSKHIKKTTSKLKEEIIKIFHMLCDRIKKMLSIEKKHGTFPMLKNLQEEMFKIFWVFA